MPYGPVTYALHPASAAQATSGEGTAAARDAVPPPPPEALAQPDPVQADAQPAAPAIGAPGSEGARSTEGSDTSAASSERPL